MNKKIVYFILFQFFVIACQNKPNNNTDIEVLEDIEESTSDYVFIPINKNVKKAIEVIYSDNFEPDTMFVDLFNENFIITEDGKIHKADSLILDLKLDEFFVIERLYFIPIEKDEFVIIFTETDMDGAGSVAKRISLKNNQILWSVYTGGFNIAHPVYIDNYVYISTIGFIAKLDFLTGKFEWKFENLYEKGKYNSFKIPLFYKNDIVLFLSKKYDSPVPDSIFVDEKLKKIIRKN